jgi:hypothetical protein
MPIVHKELRRLAHHYMRQERPGHSFQTTELITRLISKLVDLKRVRWQDRAHLVDFARSRRYGKRGGEAIRVRFEKILDARKASCRIGWRSTMH